MMTFIAAQSTSFVLYTGPENGYTFPSIVRIMITQKALNYKAFNKHLFNYFIPVIM